jgi:LysR family glycine cleavage system transcriptional activator
MTWDSRAPPPLATLPSLHALRVFEAAARHMSFTEAARELHITQTAVSHQVKALENELELALFRRGPRRISLTSAGRAWATELGPIFTQLHAAHRKLRGVPRRGHGEVAVSIIPSFGSRWLVPRLGRFLDAHPDVELRISASAHLVDFAVEPIDLGIRYGAGRYPGLVVQKLADDALVVVAAPALLARHSVRAPRDLRALRLIHDDAPDAWPRWFARNGLPGRGPEPRAELEDSSMLVEAAVRGQGVALARWSLVVDDLAAGRLQLPFPKVAPLPTGLSYSLVAPRENLRRPAVAAFWGWVVRESAPLKTPGHAPGPGRESS